MLTASQLKEVFRIYAFRPLRRLGENYLIDANIKDKIINEFRPEKGEVVLEIGPGLGALTIDLARSGAILYAIEKDKKAFSILKDIIKDDFPNLKLLCSDILEFDLRIIASSKKLKVIGCLPFYITTPILEYLIDNRGVIESSLIMVQKEVGDRIQALPGATDYGPLSCFIQFYTRPIYIYTVKRDCFYPSPSVDSSLMRLEMRPEPAVEVKDETLFFRIIRGAFNQRRKTILNSLSRKAALSIDKEKLAEILKSVGIGPASRPESLSLSDFAAIANAITVP